MRIMELEVIFVDAIPKIDMQNEIYYSPSDLATFEFSKAKPIPVYLLQYKEYNFIYLILAAALCAACVGSPRLRLLLPGYYYYCSRALIIISINFACFIFVPYLVPGIEFRSAR